MKAPPDQAAHMIHIARAVEPFAVSRAQQFTPKNRKFRIGLGRLEELFQPARVGEGIGVEQGHPFAVGYFFNTEIVGRGEPRIFFQPDDFELRQPRFDAVQGTVRAGVVDQQHPVGHARLSSQRRKTLAKVFSRVVIDDDDGDGARVHAGPFR